MLSAKKTDVTPKALLLFADVQKNFYLEYQHKNWLAIEIYPS
jgi:hypothetical protein